MNPDLAPGLIAATGVLMVAGIVAYEYRGTEKMRASRVRLALRFPIGLDPSAAAAALDGLSGLPHTTELLAEVAAYEGAITHSLWVPKAARSSVQAILGGAIPSLRITDATRSLDDEVTLARRVFIPVPSLLLTDDGAAGSLAFLAGLAGLRSGEATIVRWALRPGAAPPLPKRDNPGRAAQEVDRAWRRKTAFPGFRVSGLILVKAEKTRARELAGHIENIFRARRGLTGGIRVAAERGNRRLSASPRTTRSSGWLSSAELLPLLALPIGPEVAPGVEVGSSRELLVPRNVARVGRQLFVGRDRDGERPVALSPESATHAMVVTGPSGSGKSTMIARAVLSDIEHGFGGVVIDPKGPDLINTILDRVPARQASRIVVLDPADTRPVPGVAVFSGGDVDLRAEVLTGALKAIFADVWGVRSDYYTRLGIRTLGEIPGATLASLGRLFADEPFRRTALSRLHDPFLSAAWQSYEALSPAAQAEHVQAPMARVMALLSRPRVRAVLASPDPKLDISRVLAEGKFLLISLSPGALGETAATFIASALMYVIWSSFEARVALPPGKRELLCLYVDELATLANGLPFGFELLAERARGLGGALTVAVQTLGRVPEPTRSALLGNVASFVSFRAGAEEAPRIARQLPGLTAQDVMSLGRFEVAARVGTGSGSAFSVMTGRTEPLSPGTGQAEPIRDRSAERYGTASSDAELPAADAGDDIEPDRPVGRTRRSS